MIQCKENYKGYTLKFPYNPAILADIKLIEGRKFNPTNKEWKLPREARHQVEALLSKWGEDTGPRHTPLTGPIDELPDLKEELPLKRQLFPYQAKGVAYTLEKKRVIVGDEPGLGKTGQAIAAAVAANAFPCLIICPATLKENWLREWSLWTNKRAMILNDQVKNSWWRYSQVGMIDVFICNYESLKKYFVEKIDTPAGKKMHTSHIIYKEQVDIFKMVIVDEVHRCKSGSTQQTKFTMGIIKGKEYRLALTGTPVVNKPDDLIPQLYILGQMQVFGGHEEFTRRYCQGKKNTSTLKELNYLLHKNCYYRRAKKDVLKELPDKMRDIVRCEITTKQEYDKAERDLARYLKENLGKTDGEITQSLRGEAMVLINVLKQISARGKFDAVEEHIKEVTDAGEKIVVFCHHNVVVQELRQRFPGSVTITGQDDMGGRTNAIDKFMNDPRVQVIICSIKAAGVGITLTSSSRVLFTELPWHPADADQCEDRCHRIGQKNSVQVSYFLGAGTIDEDIYNLIEEKRKIANQITGGEDTVQTNIIDAFINLFKSRL